MIQLFSYPDVFSLTLDPAAGQTTSQQPPPFTLPRTLGQPPSSTSALQNFPSEHPQMLDRSQSAPAAVRQASASGLCQDHPGDQELPQPSASAKNVVTTPHQVRPPSPPLAPVVSPSEVLGASFPAEVTTQARDPDAEVKLGAGEGGAGPEESINTTLLPQPEECSPTQAMEQEEVQAEVAEDAGADFPADPTQSDPVEMEFPVDSQDAGSSEGDQPERERPSCSDSIPSLAAALMELHELLESNSQAHATSCSSSQPVKQETGQVGPDSHTPALDVIHIPGPAVTPGAESSDAKANTLAAVSDEGPPNCVAPGLSKPEGGGTAENEGEQRPPRCPEGSVETTTQEHDEAEKTCVFQADPDAPSVPVGEAELRGPVDGCQGDPGLQSQHVSLGPSGAAGEVSDTSISSVPPLPEAPQLPSPDPAASTQHPFINHFPAEHIQRIQAAGFSASEAAEALQRAHGVVELALLALLARSITVPT